MSSWMIKILDEYAEEYENATVRILAIMIFIFAIMCTNLGYGIFFIMIDVKIMSLYNFVTFFSLVYAMYLILFKHRFLTAQYIAVVGFCVYIVYSTYLFGYNKNAYILFFPLLFATYTISPARGKKELTITSMIIAASFLTVIYFRFKLYSEYSASFNSMELVNSIFAIGSTVFIISTMELSEKLVGNIRHKEIENLEKKMNVDFLTGLWNKRYVENEFNKRKDFSNNYIVLADIDFFKVVNDTYGHVAGDYILKEVAKIIKKYFRDDDIVARWGGEEFLILMKDINSIDLIKKLDVLREEIKNKNFDYSGFVIKVTMTFGVKRIDENLSMTENIEHADSALYSGKENGRNQVVYYKVENNDYS